MEYSDIEVNEPVNVYGKLCELLKMDASVSEDEDIRARTWEYDFATLLVCVNNLLIFYNRQTKEVQFALQFVNDSVQQVYPATTFTLATDKSWSVANVAVDQKIIALHCSNNRFYFINPKSTRRVLLTQIEYDEGQYVTPEQETTENIRDVVRSMILVGHKLFIFQNLRYQVLNLKQKSIELIKSYPEQVLKTYPNKLLTTMKLAVQEQDEVAFIIIN